MKKRLSILLALMVLCCAMPTLAAANTINITFDGVWYDFGFYGFSLYLPSSWYEYEAEDVTYLFGNRQGTQTMVVDVIGNDIGSMRSVFQMLSTDASFSGVEYIDINNISFIAYDLIGSDAYGLVTLSEDDSLLYNFQFSPYDDAALLNLATQIIASISTSMPTYGYVVITGDGVNVRAGGSTLYAVLAKVRYGDVYTVVDIASTGWYGLEMTDGSIGYISPKVCAFID